VIVFLDDILVYSRSVEEHRKHLRQVLELLRQHRLYGKMSKCDFFKEEISFLGHVVSAQGIKMEPGKLDAIMKWPEPKEHS